MLSARVSSPSHAACPRRVFQAFYKTVLLTVLLALAATIFAVPPSLAQTLPDNDFIDWPVGACVDDRLVKGYDYAVQQDFGNHWCPENNAEISNRCDDDESDGADFNCFHAGLDMQHNSGGGGTAGEVVHAVADGRVAAVLDWESQGKIIVFEHTIREETLYTTFAHLESVWVVANQPVRRGEPVGTIQVWLDTNLANSHLHFEMRDDVTVTACPSGSDCSVAANLTQNCFGNGYSLIQRPGKSSGDPNGDTTCLQNDGNHQLDAWGFRDPIEDYFAERPDFPLTIFADGELNVRPSAGVEAGVDPLYKLGAKDLSITRERSPAGSPVGDEVWYRLETDDGSTEWANSYLYQNWSALLNLSEEWRAGNDWTPPEDDPLVDLRFGPDDLDDNLIENWAPSGVDGTPIGTLAIDVPKSDLPNDYCDQAATLDGDDLVRVLPPTGVDFRGGVAIEARVALEAVNASSGDQILAQKWVAGEEEWRLAIEGEELVFTVMPEVCEAVELRHPLPQPTCREGITLSNPCNASYSVDCPASCDPASLDAQCVDEYGYRTWVHVAAEADLSTRTMKLYWNGEEVASTVLPLPLKTGTAPIEIGDGVHGQLDDVIIWPFASDTPTNVADTVLIIDSSGSMGWNDPSNRRRTAAKTYVQNVPAGDFVGIVDFDHTSRTASPLRCVPGGIEDLEDAIDTINSSGSTNIGLGLQTGCNVLSESTSGHEVKAAILLTDGDGAYSGQSSCFADQGFKVYTFGLGLNNNDIDEVLLQQIATDTGGAFKRLPTDDLICEFQRVRAEIAGGQADACVQQSILPGETITVAANVDIGQSQATFNISWPGSDVVMTLTSPSGRVIGRSTVADDVLHEVGPTFEIYTVFSPEAGVWQVELFGADIPVGGEPVTFGFTSLPPDSIACERSGSPGDWEHCTPECPCGSGLGDCNTDADCLPGLFCAQGVGSAFGYGSGVDVCRADCHDGFPGDWQHCTAECPCGDGLGDCNTDADCLPGLFCAQNVGSTFGFAADIDVCSSDCHDGLPGDWSHCSAACPCPEGLGDCDSDSECNAGLFCVDNAGLSPDLPSNIDVCSSDCHNGYNGDWNYCTTACPCDVGGGDCSSDAECLPGLVCVNDVGPSYGFGSGIDVCEVP